METYSIKELLAATTLNNGWLVKDLSYEGTCIAGWFQNSGGYWHEGSWDFDGNMVYGLSPDLESFKTYYGLKTPGPKIVQTAKHMINLGGVEFDLTVEIVDNSVRVLALVNSAMKIETLQIKERL